MVELMLHISKIIIKIDEALICLKCVNYVLAQSVNYLTLDRYMPLQNKLSGRKQNDTVIFKATPHISQFQNRDIKKPLQNELTPKS